MPEEGNKGDTPTKSNRGKQDKQPNHTGTKRSSKPGGRTPRLSKEPSKCTHCGAEFAQPSRLKKHVQSKHHPHIRCKAGERGAADCNEAFGENKNMYRHVWAHHKPFARDPANGIPKQNAVCSECGEEFKRKDNCKRHYDEKHRNIKRGSKAK